MKYFLYSHPYHHLLHSHRQQHFVPHGGGANTFLHSRRHFCIIDEEIICAASCLLHSRRNNALHRPRSSFVLIHPYWQYLYSRGHIHDITITWLMSRKPLSGRSLMTVAYVESNCRDKAIRFYPLIRTSLQYTCIIFMHILTASRSYVTG